MRQQGGVDYRAFATAIMTAVAGLTTWGFVAGPIIGSSGSLPETYLEHREALALLLAQGGFLSLICGAAGFILVRACRAFGRCDGTTRRQRTRIGTVLMFGTFLGMVALSVARGWSVGIGVSDSGYVLLPASVASLYIATLSTVGAAWFAGLIAERAVLGAEVT